MRLAILPLLIAILTVSCENLGENPIPTPNARGKHGVIDVIIDKQLYDGSTGEYLRKVFEEPYPGINRPEPYFKLRWVDPQNVGSAHQFRNQLIIRAVDQLDDSTDYEMVRDKNAIGQFTVDIQYTSLTALRDLLMDKAYDFRDKFNEEEILRYKKDFEAQPNRMLSKKLEDKFGITMTLPKNAYMIKDTAGFTWMDLDFKQKIADEGTYTITEMFMVWDEPYTSEEQLTPEGALKARDSILKKRVLSEQWDEAYMGTYMGDVVPLKIEFLNHQDKYYAFKFRGLWELKNGGYMGGPFIHLVFHDEKNDRVVNVCGSLFAPRVSQRRHVREMEAVISTAKVMD